jgi:hypothetical protein
MAACVLVHGAWGGGWAWKRVTPLLRAQGHEVFTPTLTGLGERVHLASPAVNLDTHIQDIVNVLLYEDLRDVVLVGHSYGGMVITGVLDRVPERLAHVVHLDAEVPRDGESEFDVSGPEFRDEMEQSARRSGGGWKASFGDAAAFEAFFGPWLPDVETRRWCAAKLASNGQPIETFRQPIRLSHPAADAVPRTFLRCPVDGAVWAGIYDPMVERLRSDPRWQVRELEANHLAPFSAPDLVAGALLAILRRLPPGSRAAQDDESRPTDSEVEREIRALEERLLERRTRSDPDLLSELLAGEFLEFGSSGRAWSKPEIIRALREEEGARFTITEFSARRVAPTVVLASYRVVAEPGSPAPSRSSLRSSVWLQRAGCWQLVFHQGTASPPA